MVRQPVLACLTARSSKSFICLGDYAPGRRNFSFPLEFCPAARAFLFVVCVLSLLHDCVGIFSQLGLDLLSEQFEEDEFDPTSNPPGDPARFGLAHVARASHLRFPSGSFGGEMSVFFCIQMWRSATMMMICREILGKFERLRKIGSTAFRCLEETPMLSFKKLKTIIWIYPNSIHQLIYLVERISSQPNNFFCYCLQFFRYDKGSLEFDQRK